MDEKYRPEAEVNAPYTTESTIGINLDKKRWFHCHQCEYSVETGLPNPKCGICHNVLIRLVQSHFSNELA